MGRFKIFTRIQTSNLKKITGFTFLELLLALALSSFVSIEAWSLYLIFQKTLQEQLALHDFSDRMRTLHFLLLSDLPQSGYLGCQTLTEQAQVFSEEKSQHFYSFHAENKLTLSNVSYASSMRAIEKSEGFTIRYFSKELFYIPISKIRAQSFFIPNPMNFEINEKLALASCDFAQIVKIYQIGQNARYIKFEPELLRNKFNSKAILSAHKLIQHTYFIGKTNRINSRGENISSLYLHTPGQPDVELVEGINSMKLICGLKQKGDAVEKYTTCPFSEKKDVVVKSIIIHFFLESESPIKQERQFKIYLALRNA